MTLNLSVAIRAAQADLIESTIGATAHLVILSGAKPATCVAAETGTRLAVITLPSDYLTNPADGTKALTGTWEDTSADASGTAGYFRIYNTAETVCGLQGTITATGGGGDLTLDAIAVTATQDVKITAFLLTLGNA